MQDKYNGYSPFLGHPSNSKEHSGHKRKKSLWPTFCLSLILWIIVLVLGIYVAFSCTHNNTLFIAQVHSNVTTPVQVRFGYFGICASIGGESDDGNFNPLQGDSNANTACISRFDIDEDKDLAPQFLDKLGSNTSTSTTPDSALDDILQTTTHLQTEIFPAAVPIVFFSTFVLTSLVFWALVVGQGKTAAYKLCFAATALVNSYGLALGAMAAWATQQATKSLALAQGAGILQQQQQQQQQSGVYISEGNKLLYTQWALVALCCALQFSIAALFVQRRAAKGGHGGDSVNITLMPPMFAFAVPAFFGSAGSPGLKRKKKSRCCC